MVGGVFCSQSCKLQAWCCVSVSGGHLEQLLLYWCERQQSVGKLEMVKMSSMNVKDKRQVLRNINPKLTSQMLISKQAHLESCLSGGPCS